MQYDPIKKTLGRFFNASPQLRILFYKLLNLLLLRSWHIRRELNKYLKGKEHLNVLDAGSGFGQYVYFLSRKKQVAHVSGVDVKPEQMEDCTQFFDKLKLSSKVSFKLADLTQYSAYADYDLILSVDVMEHIEEDEAVFFNFFQSLKKGGMLLISTPSDQGGSDTHDHHEGEVSGFIDEHVRDGYGVDDMLAKLKRAGFSNIKTNYTYGCPGSLAWKLSMKYPILMVNFSKLFFVLLPFYYLPVYPICYILNWFDTRIKHSTGTGLMVVAIK